MTITDIILDEVKRGYNYGGVDIKDKYTNDFDKFINNGINNFKATIDKDQKHLIIKYNKDIYKYDIYNKLEIDF